MEKICFSASITESVLWKFWPIRVVIFFVIFVLKTSCPILLSIDGTSNFLLGYIPILLICEHNGSITLSCSSCCYLGSEHSIPTLRSGILLGEIDFPFSNLSKCSNNENIFWKVGRHSSNMENLLPGRLHLEVGNPVSFSFKLAVPKFSKDFER